MTTYDNSNTGVLFTNDRKTKPGQPDFSGQLILSRELILFATNEIAAGREPKIAVKGWRKTSKAGKTFVSLAAEEPWDPAKAGQSAGPARQPAPSTPSYDDDIPF